MMQKVEGIQRSFTARLFHHSIRGSEDYHGRLKALRLYSLQRRRERYAIIRTWQILEGFVPNLSTNPITLRLSDRYVMRRERICMKSEAGAEYENLFLNSFCVRGPKLFNTLPESIRKITGVTTDTFKNKLDKWLSLIPDMPIVDGLPVGRTETNSISEWCKIPDVKALLYVGGD